MLLTNDQLLQLRASLGRWFNKDGRHWILLQEKDNPSPQDPYPYQIVKAPYHSYASIGREGANYSDIKFIIKRLHECQYTLREPKFPELQTHFRNGVPITQATLLADFLVERDDIKSAPLSSFDAMLKAFS